LVGRLLGIETMLTKFLAAPAVAAAISLIAAPAAAVDLPAVSHPPVEAAGATSHYGPWVSIGTGWGWGGGYRDRYRGRHRRGSTAGDILTGVLILGTIAAVANAANKANRERSYPYPDRYPRPYPDRRGDYRPEARVDGLPDGPQGLEGAANLCLREVERDARAREVTGVERSANGWLVTGAMADGAAFSCSIGADGRIDRIEVGGRAQVLGDAANETDRQYDDERYRSARAEVEGGAAPAYPGGPLPGEDAEPEAPES
jgi:hypothetical protein